MIGAPTSSSLSMYPSDAASRSPLRLLTQPAWNTITAAFANNSKVAFGDVNLQENQVRGKYAGSPGGGGWPTIRAYNTNTGYEGVFAGDWKDANQLGGAMCDVFGNEDHMQAYVEELGGVLLCSDLECLCARKAEGECSQKELDYHAKFAAGPLADVGSRLKLLSASLAKSGKADEWMSQRVKLLKLLAATHPEAASADKQEL